MSADFRFTVLLFLPFDLWNAPEFIVHHKYYDDGDDDPVPKQFSRVHV